MNMYYPLSDYLRASGRIELNMTFSTLEKILGFELPKSAYTYNAWWANGGHSQANAWLDAGYRVKKIKLFEKTVTFLQSDSADPRKVESTLSGPKPEEIKPKEIKPKEIKPKEIKPKDKPFTLTFPNSKSILVCNYEFHYLQDLIPTCDDAGNAIKYYPQKNYDNKNRLTLSHHGNGPFCRFSITGDEWPGVYLWVVDNQIIYIGETSGLRRRFNQGYGNISPRNCYVGGQGTNCKMNKVVLDYYERGKVVSLFFFNTEDFKRVELDLLGKIKTSYNVKGNFL